MPVHLPLLAKAKAFLATPKGRKTALIGAAGTGAVVLGLRAKNKGLSTVATDPAAPQTDPAAPGSFGDTFPSLLPPDSSVIAPPGSGQTITSPMPGDPFQFSSPSSGPSSPGGASFAAAAPVPATSPSIGLDASTVAGPAGLSGALLGLSGFTTNTGAATTGWQPLPTGPKNTILGRIMPAPTPPAAAAAGAAAGAAVGVLPPGITGPMLQAWLAGLNRPAPPPPPPPPPPFLGSTPWGGGSAPKSLGLGGVKPAPRTAPPGPIHIF